jgi:hypothetical protein
MEESDVPGVRVPSSNRRADVVVVAAHYGPDRRVDWVQAYERRGRVWGDKVLLDRNALVERLQRRQRIHAGAARAMPGDFELGAVVELQGSGPGAVIVASGKPAESDALGVPVV